jgi:predicted ATPase
VLTSLKITGFRTFESLTIEDLGRVNLFVGENGSGKTAVLEAVELVVKGGLRSVLADQLISRKEYLYRKDERGGSSSLDVSRLFHGFRLEDGQNFQINDQSAVVFDPGEVIPDTAPLIRLEKFSEKPTSIPLSPEGGILPVNQCLST